MNKLIEALSELLDRVLPRPEPERIPVRVRPDPRRR